jgi:hypothetical protein
MSVSAQQQDELRETLRLFAAPTALTALFAHVPEKFVEQFVLFVFVECVRATRPSPFLSLVWFLRCDGCGGADAA